MFKQLAKLSNKNPYFIGGSSFKNFQIHQKSQLIKTFQVRSFGTHAVSSVSQDYSNQYLTQQQNAQIQNNQGGIAQTKRRAELLNLIPDYEVKSTDTFIQKKIQITEEQLKENHPAELSYPAQRKLLDYSNMGKNEMIMFNLPNDQTVQSVTKLVSHKGVHVQDVTLSRSIDDTRIAFARVSFASPREAQLAKKKLYNFWIGSNKLKVKTKEDMSYETFNNRTVIVRNLPSHIKDQELFDLFGEYGALVGIEMPMENQAIKEHLKNKVNDFQTERAEQREKDFRRAQLLVKESILLNPDIYKEFIEEELGGERALNVLRNYNPKSDAAEESQNQFDVLDSQRQISISHILTQLQSETKEVHQAKRVLQELRQTINVDVPSLSIGKSVQNYESELQSKKEVVKNAVSYINKNRDAVDESTLSGLNYIINAQTDSLDPRDSIQKLQELSREELALAYDSIIIALEQREKIIHQRIKEQYGHMGMEERILFEGKDFTREFEDLQSLDPFNSELKIEQVLSVSEQVNNIHEFKNISPEEKLAGIVTKKFNPFNEANFNLQQLSFAQNPSLADMREMPYIDPKTPQSLAREIFPGAPFKEEMQQQIDEKVKEIKDKFDLPFDELYHKEKRLIDQVIKAEKSLKEKQSKLAIPFGKDRLFNPSELPSEISRDPLYQAEHQFVRDQRKQNEKLYKEQIDQNSESTTFEHILSQENGLEKMKSEGLISEKEYDLLLSYQRDFQMRNLGYAFLTFSNTVTIYLSQFQQEEAKYAIIMSENERIDNVEFEALIKGQLDHKDFDVRYKLQKEKNDSKIVDELERLIEAKKELREFERSLDSELPKAQKLKEFRELARDVIENKIKTTRAEGSEKRTVAEEEMLNQKIRQLQKEFPDLDLTQLFDTERAEAARKAQHKKAFASYKAFQFLKHGVEMQAQTPTKKAVEDTATPKMQSYEAMDPYNFPPVEETVARFLTKDKFPRIIDNGDPGSKHGRKFEYSHQDFLESYYGKDNTRQLLETIRPDDSVFGYNEDLKNKYPIDKYLQMPTIESQLNRLRSTIDVRQFPNKFSDDRDQKMVEFNETFDIKNHNFVKDTPHPSEKGRSLLKDTEARLQSYFARRERTGKGESWNTRDVAMIKKQLRDEYFPRPKKAQPVEVAKVEDTKVTEKFEPFYEGEHDPVKSEETVQDQSQSSTSNDSPIIQKGQRKQDTPKAKQPRQQQYSQKQEEDFDQMFYKKVNTKLIQDQQSENQSVQANKNFLYDYKHIKNTDPQNLPNDIQVQRLERAAKANNMTAEQLLDQLKEGGNLLGQTQLGGEFTEKQRFGMINDERDIQGRERSAKGFNEFARESESEREDEDIYNHYMNEMKKAQQEKAKEQKITAEQKLAQSQIDNLEKMFPEVPRFEGFFKSQSQGKHPFDEQEYKFQDNEGESFRQADEKYDEELYERELRGRMIGEKLTPRQFGVLYNAQLEEGQNIKFMKDEDRKQFINNRDIVRILDEVKESIRRERVIQGEWTEEESQDKINQLIKDEMDKIPPASVYYKQQREMKELQQNISMLQNSKQVLEKEYYFDEGLGQSVQQHVNEIKQNFPDVEVLVRRDRDGYPIIKTLYKPKYKYNLDDFTNIDAKKYKTLLTESLEDIALDMLPEKGNPESLINKAISDISEVGKSKYTADFDQETTDKLNNLIKERVQGKFVNDRQGFVEQLHELSKHAKYDETKKVLSSTLFRPNIEIDTKSIIEELEKDRAQITMELMHQITLRARDFLFFQERKDSDFVQGKRSEINLFAKQTDNYEKSANILEKQSQDMSKQQNFDKEAYQKIKQEIKRRREAKERLLQQGFPELKPYLAF